MRNWAARAIGFLAATGPAAAMADVGKPTNWGLGLQEAASPTMERIASFHDMLLIVITVITLFVTALLAIVVVRFNRRANPTPSKTTHNTLIEVVWTAAPVIILVLIAIPSFKLLYFADRVEDPELTVKAVGVQWYWRFEVPEQDYKGEKVGGFAFESRVKPDADLKEGDLRLLSVDKPLHLPVGTKIQVLVTANDVLHNYAMPSLGLKLDAVPGRLNETWTLINPGFEGKTFYGQCSELCGNGHAYMPTEIRAETEADFVAWVKQARADADAGENDFELLEAALPAAPDAPKLAHAASARN